jgi:hypothetical protein
MNKVDYYLIGKYSRLSIYMDADLASLNGWIHNLPSTFKTIKQLTDLVPEDFFDYNQVRACTIIRSGVIISIDLTVSPRMYERSHLHVWIKSYNYQYASVFDVYYQ